MVMVTFGALEVSVRKVIMFSFLFWLVGTQKHSHLIEMNRPISDDLCIFLRVFYDFVKKVYLKIVASSSSPLQRRFLH